MQVQWHIMGTIVHPIHTTHMPDVTNQSKILFPLTFPMSNDSLFQIGQVEREQVHEAV